MQDPSALFRLEVDTDPADLHAETMVVALGGYIDAGHTQRLLIEHLLRTLDHTVLATFDVDQLIDYRARRPQMVFSRDQFTSYSDPSLALYRVVDDSGRPFLVLWGPEPDYQWERVCEAILVLAEVLGVRLMVSVHGIPMAVPHTRPIGSTLHGTTDELRADAVPVFGTVTLPGSLQALLEFRAGERGRAAVGYAIHVPHYLAQGDYPAAAAHALDRLVAAAGLDLSPTALEMAAADSSRAIASEVAESAEAAEIVQALETQYDARAAGPGDGMNPDAIDGEALPTGDELGAELEAFLERIRRPER
ncbi:MAG: PAC2 family protein [Mobilicoccus sp.]|nr:PAC2 family protein [Mobilicoccus sp.]